MQEDAMGHFFNLLSVGLKDVHLSPFVWCKFVKLNFKYNVKCLVSSIYL